KSNKPTVAFCFNDMGFPSRILQAKFGAPFTYAAFNKERNIAPGIPSLADLKKVYHYDEINAQTQVYGVIGDPVAHSLSPLIHNTAFRKLGINAVYLPFRVPRETLPEFVNAFEKLGVKGYSVTIPHKESAAKFAAIKDSPVTRTQAANTLVRTREGFSAHNTDYAGFTQTLAEVLPTLSSPTFDRDYHQQPVPASVITASVALPAGALTKEKPRES